MASLNINNPSTGERIDEIASDTSQSIASKFEQAQKEQQALKRMPLADRLACMTRFKELLLSNMEKLALDLTRETGKPISQSRGEIKGTVNRIDFFIERSPALLATRTVSPNGSAVEERVEQEPLGVIANISAWNYPYFVGLNVIAPALLAGNAVLYKPSEYATLSGLNITRLLKEAGLSAVLPVVGDSSAGNGLLDLSVDGVFFTGSYRTGQSILSKVGSRMIRVQLELGGKDGIYVADDSALEFAVPSIADGAFYNTGQGCCSVERILVHSSIYDKFRSALVKEVGSFCAGDPTLNETYIGALTRPQHITFLEEQIQDARQHGCEVLLGGKRIDRRGAFFAPTVVECTGKACRVLTEESFGPIVAIQKVDGDAEAIDGLNDSIYGLTAGVYTRQRERAQTILEQVRVGSAYWNCCDRVSPFLPWSGRKASGVGVTLGDEGIRSFTQVKAWHLKAEPK